MAENASPLSPPTRVWMWWCVSGKAARSTTGQAHHFNGCKDTSNRRTQRSALQLDFELHHTHVNVYMLMYIHEGKFIHTTHVLFQFTSALLHSVFDPDGECNFFCPGPSVQVYHERVQHVVQHARSTTETRVQTSGAECSHISVCRWLCCCQLPTEEEPGQEQTK